MKAVTFGACCLILFFVINLAGAASRNTLVIVDDMSMIDSHSQFFALLSDRGHQLDFKLPNDDINFIDMENFQYDSLILFAPSSVDWSAQLDLQNVLQFIDRDGGNVLIAGDRKIGFFVDELAAECGANFGDSGDSVVDHIHFENSDFDGEHTMILADNLPNAAVSGKISNPILYHGNGMTLSQYNRLVFPILTGSSSSFCGSAQEQISDVTGAGNSLTLVAGLQARNNGRVVITGSVDMFSNEYFDAQVQRAGDEKQSSSGNKQFADNLTKWNFGDHGVIRVKSITHHLQGESEPRPFYTIKDDIEYIIEIEEWNGKEWVGYSSTDVQLEVQMLDPYIRRTLTDVGNGKFATVFKAPDTYGVFTFKVDYHRVGYSSLSQKNLVTIRPYRHDQYERFISSAFPYYAGAFSMMGGVALFSVLYLFSK